MVILDDQERIFLVKQYRRAADRYLLELPAGTRDHASESAEECAARETQEETGYSAAHIERLGGFYSAPGFSSEYLECFLCTDLGGTQLHAEEDEDLTLTPLTLDELKATIQRGEIEDAKTLAGVFLYMTMKGK